MSAEIEIPRTSSLPSWDLLGDGRKVKSEIRSPLFTILSQINIAAENGLDIIAISMAVALPDICASLMSEDGRTSAARYKAWCADNLDNIFFSYVTPEDLYSIRCGVLHNGRYGDLKHDVARVVFVPGHRGGKIGNNKAEDTWLYGTVEFCRNVNRAVVAWYTKNQDNPNIQANMLKLMQYRDGFAGISMSVVA